MKSQRFFLSISLLFSVLLSLDSFCQTESQKEALLKIAEKRNNEQQQEKNKAFQMAKQKDFVLWYDDPTGASIELQSLQNGRPHYYITDNLNAAKTLSTNQVWPGGLAGLSLNGTGQILGEWDANAVRLTHQELTGRVTQMDGTVTLHDHSTHVAGTLIASGVNANAKGMSFAASLQAYEWNSDDAEMAAAAAGGLKISNHSYGYIAGWYNYGGTWYWYGWIPYSETEDYGFGYYDEKSASWDEIAYNAPGYLILKSAGNDRGEGPAPGSGHYAWIGDTWTWSTTVRDKDGGTTGYDCISYNGTAKNILTVGAVNDIVAGYSVPADVVMSSFSCWGPTDDGRIKPDIVGNGVGVTSSLSSGNTAYGSYNGTSMATPNVAGSLGLLLQHKENLDGNSENWKAASLKALVLHTADEAGANPGPDYAFGWGLMNTETAANLLTEDNTNGGSFNIRELSLSNGDTYQTTLYSDGINELKATIVWTDPAATPVTPSNDPPDLMLVNDLDMRITDPMAVVSYPYILDPANPANAATTGDNFRDNVEQIVVSSGTEFGKAYSLTINHKGALTNGMQAYSLILSGITPAIQPQLFWVIGGGNYCEGTDPTLVSVTLTGSETQTDYQLLKDGNPEGAPLSGTGMPLEWFNLTAGNYTVLATNAFLSVLMSGSALVTQLPIVVAEVEIQTNQSLVCAGTSVDLNALTTNGGNSPVYEWFVNGISVGNNASILTYTPEDNDMVYVELTPDLVCPEQSPVASNTISFTVQAWTEASVIISNMSGVVCDGDSATITAETQNEGTNPLFEWFINDIYSGNDSFLSFIPTNGDEVYLRLTSSENCLLINPVQSNTLTIEVNTRIEVLAQIVASTDQVCEGSEITFYATTSGDGNDPVYSWEVNGSASGPDAETFVYAPSPGDEIQLILTSSETCTVQNPVGSNTIAPTVNPIPEVYWNSFEPDTLCVFWEAIPLNGGTPEGGIYSGNGVINNLFYPSSAGLGEHQIIYTYTSDQSCSSSASYTLFVDVCSGLDPVNSFHNIQILPNPANEQCKILFDPEQKIQFVELMNDQGISLFQIKPENNQMLRIRIDKYPSGVYILRIHRNDQTIQKQLIIRH